VPHERPGRTNTYFDFPAEHWKHLRTTTPMESVFATVGLRQQIIRGAGNHIKLLTMAFKFIEMVSSAGANQRLVASAWGPAAASSPDVDCYGLLLEVKSQSALVRCVAP
jgi:hypothetical protein